MRQIVVHWSGGGLQLGFGSDEVVPGFCWMSELLVTVEHNVPLLWNPDTNLIDQM